MAFNFKKYVFKPLWDTIRKAFGAQIEDAATGAIDAAADKIKSQVKKVNPSGQE